MPKISINLTATGANQGDEEFKLSLTLSDPDENALATLVRAVQLAFAVATGKMNTSEALQKALTPTERYVGKGPGGRD